MSVAGRHSSYRNSLNMATSDCPQGCQCEFIDSVPEDFYCKKCTLVARRLTFTSCCGESYCHACITDIQEQGKPCPACEKEAFTTVRADEVSEEGKPNPSLLQHEGEGV